MFPLNGSFWTNKVTDVYLKCVWLYTCTIYLWYLDYTYIYTYGECSSSFNYYYLTQFHIPMYVFGPSRHILNH